LSQPRRTTKFRILPAGWSTSFGPQRTATRRGRGSDGCWRSRMSSADNEETVASVSATPIVVVGAGGFAREVLDVLGSINAADVGEGSQRQTFDVLGVVDDNPTETQLGRLAARSISYLGIVADLPKKFPSAEFLIAIGSPEPRRRIAKMLHAAGMTAAVAIHPRAVVGTAGSVGPGVVVCSGAQISTNVSLGDHVHINPGSIVGHDADLREFVSVNPGAVISGEVTVHSGSLIGAGGIVLQGLVVGSDAVVGAGAVVVRDVPSKVVVKGVPAG
jgi:sugar O-acyltransferase (sialic acid O-acetyltransferase NeuD family)